MSDLKTLSAASVTIIEGALQKSEYEYRDAMIRAEAAKIRLLSDIAESLRRLANGLGKGDNL